MVDEQAGAGGGRWVDLDSGEPAGQSGEHPGDQLEIVSPEPMVDAVSPDRVEARVAEDDLKRAAGSGIALPHRLKILSQCRQHPSVAETREQLRGEVTLSEVRDHDDDQLAGVLRTVRFL